MESVFLERPFVILWKNVPWMEACTKCVDNFRPRSVRFHLREIFCQWTSILPSEMSLSSIVFNPLSFNFYRCSIDICRSISLVKLFFFFFFSRFVVAIVTFSFLRGWNHIEERNPNFQTRRINSMLSIIWWINYENFVFLLPVLSVASSIKMSGRLSKKQINEDQVIMYFVILCSHRCFDESKW